MHYRRPQSVQQRNQQNTPPAIVNVANFDPAHLKRYTPYMLAFLRGPTSQKKTVQAGTRCVAESLLIEKEIKKGGAGYPSFKRKNTFVSHEGRGQVTRTTPARTEPEDNATCGREHCMKLSVVTNDNDSNYSE